MKNENNKFSYTYSAEEQEEIQNIREKYMPHEESKIEQLRRLDRSVTYCGKIWSIIVGTVGTLVFGVGMCCVMEWNMMLEGVVISLFGFLLALFAYPLFKMMTAWRRKKLSPQILKLTEELMK